MSKFTTEYFEQRGIKVLSKLPEGWVYIAGAMTAPSGYKWASNNKSRFGGQYEHALIKEA